MGRPSRYASEVRERAVPLAVGGDLFRCGEVRMFAGDAV